MCALKLAAFESLLKGEQKKKSVIDFGALNGRRKCTYSRAADADAGPLDAVNVSRLLKKKKQRKNALLLCVFIHDTSALRLAARS